MPSVVASENKAARARFSDPPNRDTALTVDQDRSIVGSPEHTDEAEAGTRIRRVVAPAASTHTQVPNAPQPQPMPQPQPTTTPATAVAIPASPSATPLATTTKTPVQDQRNSPTNVNKRADRQANRAHNLTLRRGLTPTKPSSRPQTQAEAPSTPKPTPSPAQLDAEAMGLDDTRSPATTPKPQTNRRSDRLESRSKSDPTSRR